MNETILLILTSILSRQGLIGVGKARKGIRTWKAQGCVASFWYQTERFPQIAMRLPSECYQMRQSIQHYMPHLRESQQKGLTLWVYGTILAGSGCQNAVAVALSFVSGFNTMRQYLREWLYDGADRSNPCLSQVEVSGVFRAADEMGSVVVEVGQTRARHRPDDEGGSDKRAGDKRGLSRLRDSDCLAHPCG